MSITQEDFTRAIDFLGDAVDTEDLERIDAEVQNVASIVADAIAEGADEEIRESVPRMERLYSRIRVRPDRKERDDMVAGQLRALTTLFTVGSQQRRGIEAAELVVKHRRILEALAGASEPLDNKALAKKIDRTEETVARAMPVLRDAGLVATRAEWRRRVNSLTNQGRAAIEGHREASEVGIRKNMNTIVNNVALPVVTKTLSHAEMVKALSTNFLTRVKGHFDFDLYPVVYTVQHKNIVPIDMSEWGCPRDLNIFESWGKPSTIPDPTIAAGPGGRMSSGHTIYSKPVNVGVGAGWTIVDLKRAHEAVSMPEIAVLELLYEGGTIKDVAAAFRVEENAAEERLDQLGVKAAGAG
ncbi:hypothetical protein [Dongia sedimenti]|uniref:Helix-turn-helix domain-containing protein n=1 Tax=Dongia sedimenti TaxID=3064282 RepID=A0ABU0YVM9_9PROT|nr:helix-turn-helix domain-containing protein [Rhodospirillaceae bacterium R-7]